MSMRGLFSGLAVALALGTASVSHAQDSSTEMRPAQMPRPGPCDDLLRQVEVEMPSALGLRLASAQRDVAEARELCSSGQPREGEALLRGVLDSVHEGG
jgi:hypothetical protein